MIRRWCAARMIGASLIGSAWAGTATISSTVTQKAVADYVQRDEVLAYLQEVSRDEKIPLEWLKDAVSQAAYSPLSEKYTTPKPNANKKTTPDRNFLLYQRNLVNQKRIDDGAAFMRENAETFERIEKETGVSRYRVAAIIGIESIYGQNMGRFRVIDALMTLSFDYTRRASYYKRELAKFLHFCYSQQIPATSVQGSFAGAIGLGQFMPASLLAYGRDGDGDGHIDIVNNPADGIASVANFLKVHGWAEGEKPLYRVNADETIFKATRSGGIKPNTTWGKLKSAGVSPQGDWTLPDSAEVLLVDLPWITKDDRRGVDYYAGTPSFSAILHYNRSYFYRSAVTFLGDRIEEALQASATEEKSQAPKTP